MADDVAQELLAQREPCSWTVGGQRVVFPAFRIRHTGGNRIVRRERPYRDGARLDDTGSEPDCWAVDALFNNTIQEPGLEQNGFALYPDALDALLASFAVHETGDLVLPTVGRVRCRAKSFDRLEQFEARDEAVVCFTFEQDNEDLVDFRRPGPPTVGGSAVALSEKTTFSAQSAGSWHDALGEFQDLLGQMETLFNTPANVAEDVRNAAAQLRGSAQRAIETFSHPQDPARDAFCRPGSGSRAERRMVLAQDIVSRQTAQARSGDPRLVGVVLLRDSSLFRISATTGQRVEDLIEWNPQLDASFIPAGAVVLVQAS